MIKEILVVAAIMLPFAVIKFLDVPLNTLLLLLVPCVVVIPLAVYLFKRDKLVQAKRVLNVGGVILCVMIAVLWYINSRDETELTPELTLSELYGEWRATDRELSLRVVDEETVFITDTVEADMLHDLYLDEPAAYIEGYLEGDYNFSQSLLQGDSLTATVALSGETVVFKR